MKSDEEFLESLKEHLSSDGEIEPSTPIFRRDDGTIDREKTLALLYGIYGVINGAARDAENARIQDMGRNKN